VATTLLDDLAARAREEGIERFSASVLAGNEAMLAVFRDLADVRVTGGAKARSTW
jgi:RimJ/RimL family protein N-acetyltransferase